MSHPYTPNSPAARDINYHLHPYTNPALLKQDGPHIIENGKGIYVYDDTGKKYIEGVSGLWCTALGFNNQELIDTATNQMKRLPYYHSFAGKTVNPAIDLAEKLINIAPIPMSKVYFASSGSEANDTAIKMIWYYWAAQGKTNKKKIISRHRGYHGVTIAAASLTGLPYAQDGFALPLDFALHTPCPDYFNNAENDETEEEFSTRYAQMLEDLILQENPETIAAMFCEPVQGAGGVIIPPAGYFKKIQAVLKKYDILLVADEVICGFGRTGNMWGSQTFNMRPDIITCAKALSSAYLPISAVLINKKIDDMIQQQAEKLGIFGHGYTYSAHPVSSAVAYKTLEIYERDNIIEHVRYLAPLFHERVMALQYFDIIDNPRAVGLLGAIELYADKSTKTKYDITLKNAFKTVAEIQKYGVILRALPYDSIGLCPPLIINESELQHMFDNIESALKNLTL